MKILITGITGFAGSHLAEYLLAQEGYEVYGTIRWRSDLVNIAGIKDKLRLIECDTNDAFSVMSLIESIRPAWIFHLAAQSYVHFSWQAPAVTMDTNIIGQVNVLEAVRRYSPETKVQIAGSSEEYGMVNSDEIPIRETNPLRPLSPYAVSKVAQDMMGYQYFRSYGLKIVRTRAFNHTGPRRGAVFATSNFARQIAEIEKGVRRPVIEVGNLDAVRDFSDVRDVVKAYALSLERGEPGDVYNIASGKGHKIGEMLDILLSLSGAKVDIRQDPGRLRPSDVALLIGSHEKFSEATGWQPLTKLEKTLEDLLNYWRQRL